MNFKIFLTAILILFFISSRARANQFSQWGKIELETISRFGLNSNLTNLNVEEHKLMREIFKKNKIRSKTSYHHVVPSNLTFKNYYEEYDKNGNIFKTVEFDKDGRIINLSEYIYDQEDKLIDFIEYTPTGAVSSRHSYKYDTNQKLSEYDYFEGNNELIYKHTYQYDKNIVEEISSSVRENTTSKIIFKYDKDKLISRSYSDKENGEVTETYIYEAKGSLIEVKAANSGGLEIFRWAYLLDAEGYPLLENFTNYIKNATSERKFEYDKNHNILKQQSSFIGNSPKSFTITKYSYNPNGDFIQTVFYGENKNSPNETFIFDKESMLIKYIEFDDNGRPAEHYNYEYKQFYSEKINIDSKFLSTDENIKTECTRNMRLIEGNMDLYSIEKGKMPVSINELIKEGYISKIPKCLKNGEYSFSLIDGLLNIKCSFHGKLY